MNELFGVAIVPLITGFIEAVKYALVGAFHVSTDAVKALSPLMSIVCGLLVGMLIWAPGDPAQGIIVGFAFGLSAAGLYSGGKATVEGVKAAKAAAKAKNGQ